MPAATLEHEMMTRLAPSNGAKTWDAEARTFRAVIAAGASVVRHDRYGPYTELLDPAGVELAANIPVLNAHRQHAVEHVLGAVVNVERVGGKLEAVLRMSKRAEVEPIVTDIRDGIITGVSVGYAVIEWRETEDDFGARTKTATKWRLLEVSLVPIPADDRARIRSKNTMPNVTEDDEVVTERDARAERAENKRRSTIYDLGRRYGAADLAAEHVDAGTPVQQFRELLMDRREAEQEQNTPRTISHIPGPVQMTAARFDNPNFRAEAMGEAIACRANPALVPSEAARPFMGLTLPDLAREHLRYAGIETRGVGQAQIIAKALNMRMGGLHSTSDFSLVLGSAVGRTLRAAYEATPSGLQPLARRVTLNDFRSKTFIQMSGFSALERVNEHGEFKRGTLQDTGESVKLQTFGRVFGITRQAIINDDLGALEDMPRKLGIAAQNFEADRLAALLMANPVMADGKALFHADHKNLAAAGAAPTEATLSAARRAMRLQKDEAGQLIGVAPRYLVVGPDLETQAEKLMAQITPAQTDAVQPVKLAIAVEPRLTGNAWFLAADPAHVDGLIYAHLEGEPGPQLETREGFDVDGVEFRVRLDFGCAFIDWRSWFKSPAFEQE